MNGIRLPTKFHGVVRNIPLRSIGHSKLEEIMVRASRDIPWLENNVHSLFTRGTFDTKGQSNGNTLFNNKFNVNPNPIRHQGKEETYEDIVKREKAEIEECKKGKKEDACKKINRVRNPFKKKDEKNCAYLNADLVKSFGHRLKIAYNDDDSVWNLIPLTVDDGVPEDCEFDEGYPQRSD